MGSEASKLIQVEDFVEITTTFPDDLIADDIAEALVLGGLVACAQVSGPVQSTYLWKGHCERTFEYKVCMKTTLDRMPAVLELLRSRHPYEVPEITARRIDWVTEDYARWLVQSTTPGIEPT